MSSPDVEARSSNRTGRRAAAAGAPKQWHQNHAVAVADQVRGRPSEPHILRSAQKPEEAGSVRASWTVYSPRFLFGSHHRATASQEMDTYYDAFGTPKHGYRSPDALTSAPGAGTTYHMVAAVQEELPPAFVTATDRSQVAQHSQGARLPSTLSAGMHQQLPRSQGDAGVFVSENREHNEEASMRTQARPLPPQPHRQGRSYSVRELQETVLE
ncbi:hypothetical protein EON66_09375, partial [archaeon]